MAVMTLLLSYFLTLAPAGLAHADEGTNGERITRYDANATFSRNGTALGNVVSAEITYANNLDRIETIRSDGRIDGADPSIAALTGRIEVRFADQTLVTQAINGEACEMEFAYVLPSGESFTFTVHAVYLPRPRIEIGGPQGIQASFDWQAARDATLGRMCTVTLINDIEEY